MSIVKVAPSLLAANFASLGEEIKAVEPFADMIHLDIMDGHFVPNITFGPSLVKALRPYTSLPFDVHLMTTPASILLTEFAQAGANMLTIHVESEGNPLEVLPKIRELGCKTGLALKPETPIDVLHPFIHLLDLVLVMTVQPGACGQPFLQECLKKIEDARRLIDKVDHPIALQVDGGISSITAPAAIRAGADILVAGSAVFKGEPTQYADNIQALRRSAHLS